MGFGDAEILEELSEQLGPHRRATVGVQREDLRHGALCSVACSISAVASSAFSCWATVQPTM
jgi:hypothetical protein